MTTDPSDPRLRPLRTVTLRRRRFVRGAASLLTLTSLATLACGDDGGNASGDGSSGGADPGDGGTTACCDESTSAASATASDSGIATGTSSDTTTGASTSGAESTGEPATDSTGGMVDVCEPTDADIEGPFYREGIPIGGNLDIHGDDGVPLILQGRVRDASCAPLAGAVVEIWHATPVAPGGRAGDVEASYDDTKQYRYYGQVAADVDGQFEFTTLRPGWYLNGAQYRPAHVHLKVWVRGVERLTTQLYFVGDPFNAADPWFNAELALDPAPDGTVALELVV